MRKRIALEDTPPARGDYLLAVLVGGLAAFGAVTLIYQAVMWVIKI